MIFRLVETTTKSLVICLTYPVVKAKWPSSSLIITLSLIVTCDFAKLNREGFLPWQTCTRIADPGICHDVLMRIRNCSIPSHSNL